MRSPRQLPHGIEGVPHNDSRTRASRPAPTNQRARCHGQPPLRAISHHIPTGLMPSGRSPLKARAHPALHTFECRMIAATTSVTNSRCNTRRTVAAAPVMRSCLHARTTDAKPYEEVSSKQHVVDGGQQQHHDGRKEDEPRHHRRGLAMPPCLSRQDGHKQDKPNGKGRNPHDERPGRRPREVQGPAKAESLGEKDARIPPVDVEHAEPPVLVIV